jgi:choline-sulfatase
MTPAELGFETFCSDQRDDLAEQSARWLSEHGQGQPFCMVSSLINPHDICHMAIRDWATTDFDRVLCEKCVTEQETLDVALQRPEGVSEEEFFARYCPPLPPNFDIPEGEPEAVQELLEERPFRRKARENWSENRWREHRWAYARLTEMVDKQIGTILDGLEAAGLADNTVVLFTSDHGDMDGTYRMEHKTFFCDKASRIPMIVRDPAGRSGEIEPHVVNNGTDLVPTVLDYAGCDWPDDLPGRSLKPLARGEDVDWLDETYIVNQIGHAIVTDRYKYKVYDSGARREQLTDLVEDPWEMRNALHDPQHRQAVQDLRERMRRIPEPVDVPDDPI